MHIHLNGSTEADIVWQELLLHPQKVKKLYNESVKQNSLALEQMEQDFAPMDAMKLEQLLLTARRIRQYLFDVILQTNNIYNDSEKEKDVFIMVTALGPSSVDIVCKVYVKWDNYETLRCWLNEKIKLAFDENGIEIPYNQIDVHMK